MKELILKVWSYWFDDPDMNDFMLMLTLYGSIVGNYVVKLLHALGWVI